MRAKQRTSVGVVIVAVGGAVGMGLSPLVSASWLWACVVIAVVLVIVGLTARSLVEERRRAAAEDAGASPSAAPLSADADVRIPAPRDGSSSATNPPRHD